MVNLSVAKGLLDPTGANIVACKSGEECLNLIQFKHFNLILLDHMMPGMDGIETLHTAKSLENSKCKDSIFIALTANAISGIRESYIMICSPYGRQWKYPKIYHVRSIFYV